MNSATRMTDNAAYSVVHVVVTEAIHTLIGPQVVDHMAAQLAEDGPGRPERAVVALIEPARALMRRTLWHRRRDLRRRSAHVPVLLLPFIGRLGFRLNARLMARRIRRHVGSGPVVFHCRGAPAESWASALRPHFERAGIVVDVRGAWPEELLFHRGFDGPGRADPATLLDYRLSLEALREALSRSGAILTVSNGMAQWLHDAGVTSREITVVPCSVTGVSWTAARRQEARRSLGLEDKLVLCYLGSIAKYQHVEDGVLPFFRMARETCDRAHLLCVTGERERMRALVASAGIASSDVTIVGVPQRDVASVLAAGDAGLLLREGTRMNRVSMPVKVAEYLASGLPLIVSRVDGWVHEIVRQHGAGFAIDWFGVDAETRFAQVANVLETLGAEGAALRERALDLCRTQFVWSGHVARVRNAYRRALAQPPSRVTTST